MIDIDKNEDQLGVVLVWNSRPVIGRYGYLTRFRYEGYDARLFFFDEHSLANQDEPIAEGSLVHYQIEKGQADDRTKAVNIQVEQFVSHDPQLDFERSDFTSFLILKTSDPIGRHLLEALSPEIKRLFEWLDKEDDLADVPPELLKCFNTIISGPLLFDKDRFAKVKLRRLTQLLLEKKPQGGELRWLNRLLLEDAYPKSFTAKVFDFDCSAPVVHASVLKRDATARFGSLELPSGVAKFHFDVFPADSLVPQLGSKVQCRLANNLYRFEAYAYDIWAYSSRASTKGHLPKMPSRVTLKPPLQFDDLYKILKDANGNESRKVPLRLADVISAWFENDPINTKNLKLKLSYAEIAKSYEGGRVRKNAPTATDNDVKFRQSSKPKNIENNPRFFATGFASDFSRWLKPYKIFGKYLFENNKSDQTYSIVRSGWHKTKPMINRGQTRNVPLYSQSQNEGVEGNEASGD